MPNQANNKDRHRTRANAVRFTEENELSLQQYQKEQNLKRTEAINKIVQGFFSDGLQSDVKIIDIETCKFHSVIINHPEFADCRKEGWKRRIPTEECVACRLYGNLKIPIGEPARVVACHGDMKKAINDLKSEKKNLETRVGELNENTKEGLQLTIDDLREGLKDVGAVIRQKDRYIKKQNEKIATLETDNDVLRRNKTPLENQGIVERITEKEKEKITEKFVPVQPQQPKKPSALVLCPRTTETVSFEDVCEKTCETFMECANYRETVMLKKAFAKQ